MLEKRELPLVVNDIDGSQLLHPIKAWSYDLEVSAWEQAIHLAELPFVYRHVAVMPDGHCGYGMPIGGVIATDGVVIPNAVGVDIGCGMCAVKSELTAESLSKEQLKDIMGLIRQHIPVGMNWRKKAQDEELMPDIRYVQDIGGVIIPEYDRARKQLGTLGGGNHFIEIQKDQDGHVWIMIHSGSRNLGKKVADHYNKLAVKLNEKYYSQVPKAWQLAFLPIDEPVAKSYMAEMEYCVKFALANRRFMMDKIKRIVSFYMTGLYAGIEFEEMINIAHNYAAWENHFKRNVIIHRKGATSAREDQIGIIPGSQGSNSYIVRGKGNPESFTSCSHGAGRCMGRKQAQRELDLAAEQKKLDDLGVIHGIRNIKDLD